jgi:hypothetical protein
VLRTIASALWPKDQERRYTGAAGPGTRIGVGSGASVL